VAGLRLQSVGLDIFRYNKDAWDKRVAENDRWTVPVSPDVIAEARKGQWTIVLTPMKPVPRAWFPPIEGKEVLCLASGGGQQAPILAAAGACVTVLDASPRQLAQDRFVAERDGLSIDTVEGDMADLSRFAAGRFDLIVHPCSNCFVPDVRPVWREAYRVLRNGGALLSGFTNPVVFTVDLELEKQGILQMKYTIPFSDVTSLSESEREIYVKKGEPLVFGHTLEDQIGGQIAAGFAITGFYEDSWEKSPLHGFLDVYLATRALKGLS
jgi:SAM-dependent methyltransferase